MICIREVAESTLRELLAAFELNLVVVPDEALIPGTYWGEPEAGLKGNSVFVRSDTPVHSLLHEACHAICMAAPRRAQLDTDAGGDDLEECAVCYLQIVLAERLPGVGSDRLMDDMDAWGYSFRLGSARAWFEGDAADALEWLRAHSIVSRRCTMGSYPPPASRADGLFDD